MTVEFIQKKYEVGDRVLFHSTMQKGFIPATVTRRREVRSITGSLLGYGYIVKRDGGEYGDKVTFNFEIKDAP